MTEHISFDYKTFLTQTPHEPGVYCMFDAKETVIYVGKAKNLKKRLASYFRRNLNSVKTEALVKHIANIQLTLTQTETEALLLENNYIKQFQPRYNVLFRDDKSFPYIQISKDKHPRIALYRGAKYQDHDYFGPYPSVGAVKETLSLLQKIFPIRQCENSFYRNRSRPCLQYQIKRCLGPCVAGLVSDEEYLNYVNYVRLFLSGHDQQVIDILVKEMEQASTDLDFEQAAKLRDRIQTLRHITEKQAIEHANHNIDVIGSASLENVTCIYMLFIRHGKVCGNHHFFPKVPYGTPLNEILHAFIAQYYLQGQILYGLPKTILLDHNIDDKQALSQTLSQVTQRKISIETHAKGEKIKTLKLASLNALACVKSKLTKSTHYQEQFAAIKHCFDLKTLTRIECFDISHMMGKQTVASCVVFGEQGPLRNEFRRYNISGITEGDDYAAMEQVLTRRYSKQLAPDKVPELIFIDGGKGQLSRAFDVFDKLKADWPYPMPRLISIAKGTERKEGLETFFRDPHDHGFYLEAHSPALLLIQQIRNASHDHALLGHQRRKLKVATSSALEDIPGVGPKRRQQLLKYMGGLQALSQATTEQIAKVPGISHTLAETIHKALKQ